MNLIPEFLKVTFTATANVQLSPINIAMLVALGLCVVIVWIWAKRRFF